MKAAELEFIPVDSDVADVNVKLGGSVGTIEKFALNLSRLSTADGRWQMGTERLRSTGFGLDGADSVLQAYKQVEFVFMLILPIVEVPRHLW